MGTPLEEAMARATDEELYDILHLNRAEYSVEAIAVAEEEVRKRGLEPARLELLQAGIERKKLRAMEPLSWPVKILLFLCGLTFFSILILAIVAVVMEVTLRGADRKYREGWRWIGYGVAVMIAIVVGYSVLIVTLLHFRHM